MSGKPSSKQDNKDSIRAHSKKQKLQRHKKMIYIYYTSFVDLTRAKITGRKDFRVDHPLLPPIVRDIEREKQQGLLVSFLSVLPTR